MKDKISRLYYKIRCLSVRRFWENIGRWFSYYNVIRKMYDFDYSSILEVERHQIERVRDSIAHFHSHLNAERDIERMNLALRLLSIVEEDGISEYHGKDPTFNDDHTFSVDPEGYYTIPVNVNTRNAHRFSSMKLDLYEDPRSGNMYKDSLRTEKAWHLYNRMRLYFLQSWWD